MAEIYIRNSRTTISDKDEVRRFLESQDVYYDHWDVSKLPTHLQNKFVLSEDEQQTILSSLEDDIQDLSEKRGYVKYDVISLSEATPNLETLLKKFESVHTHSEDEVRAIAAGSGTFVIKGAHDTGYFDVKLAAGDVISVPEGNPHFFTLTEERKVVAIRLFIDPSGWVADPYDDPEFSKQS